MSVDLADRTIDTPCLEYVIGLDMYVCMAKLQLQALLVLHAIGPRGGMPETDGSVALNKEADLPSSCRLIS